MSNNEDNDDDELSLSERGWMLLGAIGLDDVDGCMEALHAGEPALAESGMTALNKAAEWGSRRCAQELMRAGRDWRVEDASGDNALDKAAEFDAGGCAQAILDESGADAGRVGRALARACSRGSSDAAKALAAALPGSPKGLEWAGAALREAAKAHSAPCLEAVLGAWPNEAWPKFDSAEAMAWAAQGKDAAVLRALLAAGWAADTRVPRSGSPEAWGEAPRARGGPSSAEGVSALDWAVARNAWDCARALLDCGADVRRCQDGGSILLMKAARGQSASVVKLLLDRRVDPNARDAEGLTALIWASRYDVSVGNERVTRALLAAGADGSARDRQGCDALDWFLRRYSSDKDVEAICERVDPRARMARVGQKKWEATGTGSSLWSPGTRAALEQGALAWSRREEAESERGELERAAERGSYKASTQRL